MTLRPGGFTTTMEDNIMTKDELLTFIENSKGNESNICQIYAIKDGETALDLSRCGFSTEDAANINSVTKGVMALLTGIAVDRGVLDINSRVMDFFPDYTPKRGEKTIYDVTVRHLLTMTAPYKFISEPWTKVCTSPDWTKAALDLLGGRKGITGKFKYTTLGIQILAGVIEKAAGQRCLDIANESLFTPLGIPVHANHGDSDKDDQFDFLMNKKPRINEWYTEPAGSVTAGWGLTLSARDMARIGVMVMSGGEYGGRRVISESWISEMTAPHVELGRNFGFMEYGYLWYRPHPGKPVMAAIGDGGNIIYADPERNIAVGITGTFKPRIFDRVQFIEEKVIPAL